jgi:Domain of unknown function (DUF4157)
MGKASTRTVTHRQRRDHDRGVAPVPHEHVAAARDPRAVLGNRSARVLLAQPSLVVGASFDPLEVEADRVAADVVRTMASGPAPDRVEHACGEGCSVHGPGPVAARAIRRAPNLAVAPIGAGGGEVQAADEATVKRARGGGASLPADFRARVEPAMGADFSGVRVHTGPAAAQLNRSFGASAFTIGSDIFFRDGLPDVKTSKGAHLVSHELTHTIQQGGAAAVARCSCGSTDQHVQRHSSFEHLMLGNVKPADLARVGAWQDAIEQTTPTRTGLSKKVRGSGGGQDKAQVDVAVGGQTLHITKAEILHVLLEEMLRLREWQQKPPGESSVEQTKPADPDASMTPVGVDQKFQVYTVRLPQGMICTYGEMNTLADYFGSVEVLKGAAAKQVRQLLQSVREETWGFLSDTYNKVADSLTKQEREDPAMDPIRQKVMKEFVIPGLEGEDTGGSFAGATAFRISGLFGQLELIGGVQGTGAQGKTNKYTPSLGRNACHFVPESWNAWADNHKKARNLATESYNLFTQSEQTKANIATAGPDQKAGLQKQFEVQKQQASDKGNEALMVNGFGDHYLQDSFAAGHMINKTQIMQFYIEFIDQKNQWDYFKDANWRKVQNIAYNQTLAPKEQYDESRVEGYNGATGAGANKAMDPQSVENRSVENGSDWKANFTALGLQVPRSLSNDPNHPTRKLLHEMRGLARGGKDSLKGSEIVALMGKLGVKANATRMAVGDMLLDGVLLSMEGALVSTDLDVTKRGKQMASMRDSRAAADANPAVTPLDGAGEQLSQKEFNKGSFRLRDELKPKKGSAPPTKTEAERQDDYMAVTYKDYLEFIQSSFLQKSTNALHDTFCKGGLTVMTAAGAAIGTVYGDDNMFNANSSVGVAHSGETAQMSRDAIVNIMNNGGDGGNTVKAIVDRFPTEVRADVYNSKGEVTAPGQTMSIEDWHNSSKAGNLKTTAFEKLFPTMNWSIKQKMAPGAAKDLGTFFTAPPPHTPF